MGHVSTVKYLIQAKVWTNQTNQNNETALFTAVERNHHEVVMELLNGGASTAIKEYKVYLVIMHV